ncbi:MAG: hypothetical protein M3R68_10650 [Acidobacteriota bacterium]|nr:hypothetical protein [Acidobacteriota bacterium]
MSKRISLFLLLVVSALPCLAQRKQPVPICRSATFAAFKPLPELSYDCPAGLIESDDRILKLPERVEALSTAVRELESFTDLSWWQADVNELRVCEIHGEAGELSAEEKEKYRSGDYQFGLFGNNSMRLVLLSDPCYQTGYNGSVAFLLYRATGKVYLTKLLDGYYSRLDNSVGFDFAVMNGEQIIEISTANTMTPAITNYYYVIDPQTHKAVPKKLFKDGKTLTNEIRSAMIIGEPSELGLPRSAKDTRIISRHRLLPTFSTYEEAYGDGNSGPKLSRAVFRWNGRFYASAKR